MILATETIGAARYERREERVKRAQRLPAQVVGHQGWRYRAADPEAAQGLVLRRAFSSGSTKRSSAVRVVGIFPNEGSAIRLVGAVRADTHDKWHAGDRRYLSDTSIAELYPERDTAPIAELEPGDYTESHLETRHSVGAAEQYGWQTILDPSL